MKSLLLVSLALLAACDCGTRASSKLNMKEFNVCEQDLRMDNRHDICFMRYWKEATVIPCSVVHQCMAERMK